MLGNRLNNISADVIFVFGVNMFLGWLRTKCSCEVHQRLLIMHQSFVTIASPKPLSRMGIECAVFLLLRCLHNAEEM